MRYELTVYYFVGMSDINKCKTWEISKYSISSKSMLKYMIRQSVKHSLFHHYTVKVTEVKCEKTR